jgi:nitrite reductase/ring-hydroxylating ferredoxin subunit
MEQAAKKKKGRGKLVARTSELMHGMTKKFQLKCRGNTVEALLVNYEGGIYAYVNRCRHIPISMDWVDNHFFTEDKRYLICANHGATYEPATGECVWGPCFGAFLQSVPLKISDGRILAYCPEANEERDG